MLEQLLKEINDLKEYKFKYECAEEDRKHMSNYIYEEELSKFKEKSYEARANKFREDTCKCCRFYYGCSIKEHLPEDIGKPIKSENWFPGYKTCEKFEWD